MISFSSPPPSQDVTSTLSFVKNVLSLLYDTVDLDPEVRSLQLGECREALPYLQSCVQACDNEALMMDLLATIDRVNSIVVM